MENNFSKNLRHLRKLNKWSQEELGDRLDIKRSSIAAYECKNVEPRLELLVRISHLFRVSISDLVQMDLSEDSYPLYESETAEQNGVSDDNVIDIITKKCEEIKALHDGFRTYYQIRRKNTSDSQPELMRLMMDIDTFSMLMDQLLEYNEQLIDITRAIGEEHQIK